MLTILIIEALANFELLRESLSLESFENGNSRKFVLPIFFDFPVRESLSSRKFLIFLTFALINRNWFMESAKRFIAKKFNGWFSDKISGELQSATTLEDIDVKWQFSVLKILRAG